MVNMKFTLLAALAVAASSFVAADDPTNSTVVDNSPSAGNGTNSGSTNSTMPATNGTSVATNGTSVATNGTTVATNGTATNGTATNGTESDTPEPSSGATSGRRSLQMCEYACPRADLAAAPLALFTEGADTFTCTFASGSCEYQTMTGVLSSDNDDGQCRGAAVPLVAGCVAGQATNGGVEKRKGRQGGRRSSRDIQFEALARRLGL